MRILLDTNILISAALFPNGTAAKAYVKAVTYPNKGIVCDWSIDELRRVFNRKFPKEKTFTQSEDLCSCFLLAEQPRNRGFSTTPRLFRIAAFYTLFQVGKAAPNIRGNRTGPHKAVLQIVLVVTCCRAVCPHLCLFCPSLFFRVRVVLILLIGDTVCFVVRNHCPAGVLHLFPGLVAGGIVHLLHSVTIAIAEGNTGWGDTEKAYHKGQNDQKYSQYLIALTNVSGSLKYSFTKS